MLPYFTEVYGNPSSLYSVGQKAKEELEEAIKSAVKDYYDKNGISDISQ